MINLLLVSPQPESAVSLYRSLGPLTELRKKMDLHILFLEKPNESTLHLADIIFMERPCTATHVSLAQTARDARVPLWIDYDDLLFGIEEENPTYAGYMNPDAQERVKTLLSLADVVTVSTAELGRRLAPYTREAPEVIRNGLLDRFLHLQKTHNPAGSINWRGSETHVKDLFEFKDPILCAAKKYSGKKAWTWMGYNPWFITQEMSREQSFIFPTSPPADYFRAICEINPAIQIVPLSDNPFNHCKSDIAYLEATLAGAVCIGPQWEEWAPETACAALYKNAIHFAEVLDECMTNPKLTAALHSAALHYVKNNRLTSQLNVKREGILESLIR